MPVTATPVNSNAANAELAVGYAICLDDQSGLDYLYYTNEFQLDPAEWTAIETAWLRLDFVP